MILTSRIKYKIIYDTYNTYYIDKEDNMYRVYINEDRIDMDYYGYIKNDFSNIVSRFEYAESIINYEKL